MTNSITVGEALRDLPQIPTERMLLRRIRVDDADDIFAYASDASVTATLIWDTHLSIDDSLAYIESVVATYEAGAGAMWGIEHQEQRRLIGTVGFNSVREAGYVGVVGYALARPYWGQGLMTEALRHVIDFGFRHMGLWRIEATCRSDNIGSYRVLEKGGMQLEGVLRDARYVKGRLETIRLYSILRRDYRGLNRPARREALPEPNRPQD